MNETHASHVGSELVNFVRMATQDSESLGAGFRFTQVKNTEFIGAGRGSSACPPATSSARCSTIGLIATARYPPIWRKSHRAAAADRAARIG